MTQLKSIKLEKAVVLGIFFVVLAFETFAQVSIAPTSLFFDSQNRFSSLTVSNGGQEPQEISISFEFGYPASENGNFVIKEDSLMALQKSLADWLRVFPQSFVLQPNQRQVVRFVTQPPQGLNPGGYWARVKISSTALSPPIGTVGANQIGAQINLVIEQVIAAHYRTPGAATGVRITSVDFSQEPESGFGLLSVAMEQTGNAPFIGSIDLAIRNSSGQIVYQTNTTNSVYTNITRTFRIDTSDWPKGQYTVSGIVDSQRRDISSENLLHIDPVRFTEVITIN